ncbi:MAG TPA: MFS transporter [Verrucomicrobiae bacterium]|nr:MFS transporter [Verrucomicrobiae bacterium]
MPNLWPNCPGMPAGAVAALAALHLSEPRADLLALRSERDAHDALAYCDRSQITLAMHRAAPEFLPEEMTRRAEKNLVRLRNLEQLYDYLRKLLSGAGLDFIALKGITQCAFSGMRPEDRVQYDVDLYLPGPQAEAACKRLLAHGYQQVEGMDAFPTDHLPALVPPAHWEWRGDYFAADLPLAVELHFRFWDAGVERLHAPGVEEFWNRRTTRVVSGLEMPVLRAPDAIGYAALHLLKHVLRGDTRPFHVYELALCLHNSAADEDLWREWQALHAPELRRLEAVAFRLSEAWFGPAMAPAVREEIERLPAATLAWFDDFWAGPARSPFVPNKDELWLHLSLLSSSFDRLTVARRRLLPGNLPPRGSGGGQGQYARRVARRLRHHAIALFTTGGSGARWWLRTSSFGPQFWVFLAAAVVFNLALFIFFLLYNLFLADAGFDVRALGEMNGAARLGSLVGTLPAAYIAHRLGLRKALLGAIASTAVLTLLRAFVVASAPVLGLAFTASAVFSLWAVVMAPSIAAAVEDKRRTAAFSVFFSTMFATGIVGNWVGGQLPGWLHGKRPALVFAAVLCGSALAPAWRLRLASVSAPGARIYPRGPFLVRFLAPFAIWHLATGVFNPFNNVYLARLRFSVAEIGSIFSAAQVVQVFAVLAAPLVTRRAGLVGGIAWMMCATALALAGLAAEAPGARAIAAYVAYMSCQWMSEPGLNALLMQNVGERERGGASAMNYLVAFSAQTVAAFAAGALLEQFGFGPVLLGAAAAAGAAAMMFRTLL